MRRTWDSSLSGGAIPIYPSQRWIFAGTGVAAVALGAICDGLLIIQILPRGGCDVGRPPRLAKCGTSVFSLVVANGLCSVSTLLCALAFRRRPSVSTRTVPIGVAVLVGEMLLAVTWGTGVPKHAVWATVPTIDCPQL